MVNSKLTLVDNELRSGEYTVVRYDILDTFLKDKPIAVPYELKIFS